MTNYREILRLKALGMNKQETAASVGCSRNTVAEVLRRAEALNLSYPLADEITDSKLAALLYPSATAKPVYKMPDYAYVAKEMMKDGITLNLLWLNTVSSASPPVRHPINPHNSTSTTANTLPKRTLRCT